MLVDVAEKDEVVSIDIIDRNCQTINSSRSNSKILVKLQTSIKLSKLNQHFIQASSRLLAYLLLCYK